ncbi:5'/3'-nucleotidase SurE [Cyanothece sp. BG0011]|uniref:5'/3'-nucleotidase SurE n=1 Tax=Cyanothece sp. BG0011 TaxID=2082950 RepID=UPI000D1F43BD
MTNPSTINILISNDDGIFALGVRTLANTLAQAGYQVTVVCPDRERSATGHGLTLHRPIRANLVEDFFNPKITAWSCSGTPSDCVKLALSTLIDNRPDFIISGINHGSNLGTDVLYSGTVSAAMEGIIEGIPSIAMSLASFSSGQFQPGADFACRLVQQLSDHPLPDSTLLNVNIPPVAADAIAGVMLTRQGLRRYIENFEKRLDPRGKSYYWLAGELVTEIEQPNHIHLPSHILTDVQGIQQNYITLTPLQYNLTDVASFEYLQKNQWLDSTPDLT